ncbi:hypothetical protein [Nocardiopsis suaedae]|uniref:DUF1640 domain-containing protein n=1 Tax=Nocardiopsis suaedae TaxID=3018444 RepID=A0ABT4TH04_9ACTN|nr:hypothetical protein [Nocardiopsis suaedae]MDA2803675.1 hypothetical protein [Nocardiopsis suaedae]
MRKLERRLANLEAAFVEHSLDKKSIQAYQANTDDRINSLADAFMEHRRETREGFRQVNLRFDAMDARLGSVEGRLDSVGNRLGSLESDVATLKSDVATLKSDVATLKSDVATLKTQMSDTQDMVARIVAHLGA